MLRFLIIIGAASYATSFSVARHSHPLLPSPSSLDDDNNNARRLRTAPVELKASRMMDLDESNYEDALQGTGNKAILVDVHAKWCGPCKLIEPILERCGEKWADRLIVMKYDVEANILGVKMEFVRQKVLPQKLPSLVLFKDGKALALHKGLINDEQMDDFLRTNLAEEEEKELAGSGTRSGFVSFAVEQDDYMLSGVL